PSQPYTLSLHDALPIWSPATPLVFANKLVPTASSTVIPHGTTATITITVKDGTGHVVSGAKVTASGAGVVITSKLTGSTGKATRSEEHTSELQSRSDLV